MLFFDGVVRCFMKILKKVYDEMLFSTEYPPPESGGILGGCNETVTLFVEDKGNDLKTSFIYEPNTAFLNKNINEWINNDIDFMGVYHSHPCDCETLSDADVEYINRIMESVKGYTNKLYFPLVIPKKKMISYYALIVADKVQIIRDAIQLI